MAQKPIRKKYLKSQCPPYGWIGQFSPELIQMITQQPLLLLKPQRKLFLSLLFSNQMKWYQTNDIPRGDDSATKEPNRRTSRRESRAQSFMEISTSTTEYVPLRSVLRGSICHFQSNLWGQLHVVQPLSSDSSFRLVPWIWIRLWLSYDLLFFSEN